MEAIIIYIDWFFLGYFLALNSAYALLILLSLDLAKITLWKFKGFCPQ